MLEESRREDSEPDGRIHSPTASINFVHERYIDDLRQKPLTLVSAAAGDRRRRLIGSDGHARRFQHGRRERPCCD